MKASSAEAAATIRVRIAAGLVARARGLLWHPPPAPGTGLLLAGVRRVHGFGLRRPLDLVYLDGEGRVLACAVLAPWRISSCHAAAHVLELQRGECARLRLVPGRRLQFILVEDIFGRARCDGRRGGRTGDAPSSPAVGPVIAGCGIALTLAAWQCLASAPTSGDGGAAAVTAQAASPAPPAAATTVDRHVGEPRRHRVRKARASLHRDAADGTPARPLRKARPRRPRHPQAHVEYLVGEPGRHGSRSGEQAAQGHRKDEPDRRR